MLSESMFGAHGSTGKTQFRTVPPPLIILPLPIPPDGSLKLRKKPSSLGSRNRFRGGFWRKEEEEEEAEQVEGTAMAGIFHECGCRQVAIMVVILEQSASPMVPLLGSQGRRMRS